MGATKRRAGIDAAFERTILREVHARVKLHFPEVNLVKDAWVYSYGRDWEFHGPGGFYCTFRATSAREARATGWEKWLVSKGVE